MALVCFPMHGRLRQQGRGRRDLFVPARISFRLRRTVRRGENPSVGGPELGQEFAVGRGREVEIASEGLSVRFGSVTSDSRCPEGAECIQQGYASIVVRLYKAGEETTVEQTTVEATAIEETQSATPTPEPQTQGAEPPPPEMTDEDGGFPVVLVAVIVVLVALVAAFGGALIAVLFIRRR